MMKSAFMIKRPHIFWRCESESKRSQGKNS